MARRGGYDYGEQGWKESDFYYEDDGDADGESRAHPAVEAEGRQKKAE